MGKDSTVTKDGVVYEKVKSIYIDAPFKKGTFRGFFGRCDDSGFTRLGLIWGDYYKPATTTDATDNTSWQDFNYNAEVNNDERKLTTIAQGGVAKPSSQWNPSKENMVDVNLTKFVIPYISAPRMISGLTTLHQNPSQPIRIRAEHQNVTPTGFEVLTLTFGGSVSYPGEIGWMALPENDIHFETGVYDTYNVPRYDNNQTCWNRVNFPRRFDHTTTVVSWMHEVNAGPGWHSLRTAVSNVNEVRFELAVSTWADRNFDSVRVRWLTFSDVGCNNRAKAGSLGINREEKYLNGKVRFDGSPFSKTPAVFMALMEFDSGDDYALRLTGKAVNISTTGFDYGCGTWSASNDHNMDHSIWVWVTVE